MMLEIPYQKVEGITNFWARVRKAERRVLLLDYDGTLAPFRKERMEARPLDGIRESLTGIVNSRKTRVAIISGRPVAELVDLLGPLPIEMVGSHGFEFRNPSGAIRQDGPDRLQSAGLDFAQRVVLAAGFHTKIEKKIGSLAVHTRDSSEADDLNAYVKSLWLNIAHEHNLGLLDFSGGVELRANGSDKGTAVLELLKSEPKHALAIYVGDDETDEDAFRVIGAYGFGIKVGGYGIRTAAIGRLPGCEAVKNLLHSWVHLEEFLN